MDEKAKNHPKRFSKRRYLIVLAIILFAFGAANFKKFLIEPQMLVWEHQLHSAREKWELNKPYAYRYEIIHQRDARPDGESLNLHLRLTYMGNTLIQVERMDDQTGTFLPLMGVVADEVNRYSIDALYKVAQEGIDFHTSLQRMVAINNPPQGTGLVISLNFDEPYGYLIDYSVCLTSNTNHCGWRYTISNFEILPLTSETNSP